MMPLTRHPRCCVCWLTNRHCLYCSGVSICLTQPVCCASKQAGPRGILWYSTPLMTHCACAGVAMVMRPETPSNPSPEGPIEATQELSTTDTIAAARADRFENPGVVDLVCELMTLFIVAPPNDCSVSSVIIAPAGPWFSNDVRRHRQRRWAENVH